MNLEAIRRSAIRKGFNGIMQPVLPYFVGHVLRKESFTALGPIVPREDNLIQ